MINYSQSAYFGKYQKYDIDNKLLIIDVIHVHTKYSTFI